MKGRVGDWETEGLRDEETKRLKAVLLREKLRVTLW